MANYQTILDAIDAAILSGAAGPGEVRSADGRTIRYRSLDELRTTRAYYARLQTAGSHGFRLMKIQSPSGRL